MDGPDGFPAVPAFAYTFHMPARVALYRGVIDRDLVSGFEIPPRHNRNFPFNTRRRVTRMIDEFVRRTWIEPSIFSYPHPIWMP